MHQEHFKLTSTLSFARVKLEKTGEMEDSLSPTGYPRVPSEIRIFNLNSYKFTTFGNLILPFFSPRGARCIIESADKCTTRLWRSLTPSLRNEFTRVYRDIPAAQGDQIWHTEQLPRLDGEVHAIGLYGVPKLRFSFEGMLILHALVERDIVIYAQDLTTTIWRYVKSA